MNNKPACTKMERRLFELNGYLLWKNGLSVEVFAASNATYDTLEAEGSCPAGLAQFHNVGPVLESLIDHSSWFDKIAQFIGTGDPVNYDRCHGLSRRYFLQKYRPSEALVERLTTRQRKNVNSHG